MMVKPATSDTLLPVSHYPEKRTTQPHETSSAHAPALLHNSYLANGRGPSRASLIIAASSAMTTGFIT